MNEQFIVICRADRDGRRKGRYVLATRRVFTTRECADVYTRAISKAREPLIVEGRFIQGVEGLRLDVSEEFSHGR